MIPQKKTCKPHPKKDPQTPANQTNLQPPIPTKTNPKQDSGVDCGDLTVVKLPHRAASKDANAERRRCGNLTVVKLPHRAASEDANADRRRCGNLTVVKLPHRAASEEKYFLQPFPFLYASVPIKQDKEALNRYRTPFQVNHGTHGCRILKN